MERYECKEEGLFSVQDWGGGEEGRKDTRGLGISRSGDCS